jgi:hypothetical protein
MTPRPGEILLVDWLIEEAERQGVQPPAIWLRLRMGKYPGVTERRVNSKVIFLSFNPTLQHSSTPPPHGPLP